MAYHLPKFPTNDLSYSTQPQSGVMTMIMRNPSTQLLTLSSADRFQTSTTANTQVNLLSGNITQQPLNKSSPTTAVVRQPWNSFILQRPQNLMEAFATRISVSEVRFPWYIPNINSYNNTIWLYAEANTPGNPLTLYPITIPTGFYDLAGIATAINAQIGITTTAVNPPVVSVVGKQFKWTPGIGSSSEFTLYWFNPNTIPTAPSEAQYLVSASLAKTLGMTYGQVSGGQNTTQPLIGNPTEGLYTQYVDIVSEKLNYYSHTKDGSSTNKTNKALLCRLYVNSEVSVSDLQGQGPFVIHRQFKTPKQIMWNKEAVIDLLDISVLDQYGNLVPLPVIAGAQSVSPIETIGAYPDFQITLLASEN